MEFKTSIQTSEGRHSADSRENNEVNEKKFGKLDIAEIQNLAFKKINISEMDKQMEYILWRGKIGAPV